MYFLDNDHRVHALDAETGEQRWSTKIDSAPGNTYGLAGCVAVRDLVACGDEDIVALRRSDGSLAWRYRASIGYSPGYFSFTAHNGTIYAGSPSGTVFAIDAATGSTRWTARPFPSAAEGVSFFEPAVDGDLVLVAFTRFTSPRAGGVVAFQAQTGAQLWVFPFPPDPNGAGTNGLNVALADGVAIAPSRQGILFGVDVTTGDLLWFFPGIGIDPVTHQVRQQDSRAILVIGDTLFASSLSGYFIAYDLKTLKELWRMDAGEGSANTARMATDGSTIFVMHINGTIVAYSAQRRALAWKAGGLPNPFLSSTVSVGLDRVFAARVDGFYALRK